MILGSRNQSSCWFQRQLSWVILPDRLSIPEKNGIAELWGDLKCQQSLIRRRDVS